MGTSIGDLYATVTLRNNTEAGAREINDRMKRVVREIESESGRSFRSIQAGIQREVLAPGVRDGQGFIAAMGGHRAAGLAAHSMKMAVQHEQSLIPELRRETRTFKDQDGVEFKRRVVAGFSDLAPIHRRTRQEVDHIVSGLGAARAASDRWLDSTLRISIAMMAVNRAASFSFAHANELSGAGGSPLSRQGRAWAIIAKNAVTLGFWNQGAAFGGAADLIDEQKKEEHRLQRIRMVRSLAMGSAASGFGAAAASSREIAATAGLEGTDAQVAALERERNAGSRQIRDQLRTLGLQVGTIDKATLKAAQDAEAALLSEHFAKKAALLRRFEEDEKRQVAEHGVEISALRLQIQERGLDAEIERIRGTAKLRVREERKNRKDDAAEAIIEESALRIQLLKQQDQKERDLAIRNLDARILQGRLGMQGKDLAAHVAGIGHGFDEQIRIAREQGRGGEVDRLGILRQTEIGAAILQEYQRRLGLQGPNAPLDARTFGGIPASGREQRQEVLEATMKDQAAVQRLIKEVLDRILVEIQGDGGVNMPAG